MLEPYALWERFMMLPMNRRICTSFPNIKIKFIFPLPYQWTLGIIRVKSKGFLQWARAIRSDNLKWETYNVEYGTSA